MAADATLRHRHAPAGTKESYNSLPGTNIGNSPFGNFFLRYFHRISFRNETTQFFFVAPALVGQAGPRAAGTLAGSINFHHEMTQPRPKYM